MPRACIRWVGREHIKQACVSLSEKWPQRPVQEVTQARRKHDNGGKETWSGGVQTPLFYAFAVWLDHIRTNAP
jgi:hypothetical protein